MVRLSQLFKRRPKVTLESVQREYKDFCEKSVRPLGIITDDQLNRLDYIAIAQRLPEGDVRKEYARVAVAVLSMTLDKHRPDAEERVLPFPNHTGAVIVTLLIAAWGYAVGGPVAALLAAAVSYWIAAGIADYRHENAVRKVQAHNKAAPQWQTTIEDWEEEYRELQGIWLPPL
jgi:hypothetical protein